MSFDRSTWTSYGSTTLFVLLWSGGAIFAKWGLFHASAFGFLLLRFILALAALLLICAHRRRWPGNCACNPDIERERMTMETNQLHRGRLIDHIQLVVSDLQASQDFYTAVLAVLEIPIIGTSDDFFWADELVVSSAGSPAALGVLTGRCHLAFQARDKAMVEAFHRAALAHGGRDNGPPGERPYHPGYYAAFVLDPDGNNIEAVYHGEAKRSARSVTVTF